MSAHARPYKIAAFAGSEPPSVTCSTRTSTRSLRRRSPSVSQAKSTSARISCRVSFGIWNCFLGFAGLACFASGFFAADFFFEDAAFFFLGFGGSACTVKKPIFSRSASAFSWQLASTPTGMQPMSTKTRTMIPRTTQPLIAPSPSVRSLPAAPEKSRAVPDSCSARPSQWAADQQGIAAQTPAENPASSHTERVFPGR